MKAYPDASLIVSAFTHEDGTSLADTWMASAATHEMIFSAWCLTEIASALASKVRAKALSQSEAARLGAAIPRMLHETGDLMPIERRHFLSAADLLARSLSPLKAADALHLAVAHDAEARLYTLDRRMAEAGQTLGLDVELLR